MQIEKRWWVWDAKFNPKEFWLGRSIDELAQMGIAMQKPDDPSVFLGINGVPWLIRVDNGLIMSISYTFPFFSLLESDIWDLHASQFIRKLNALMKPVSSPENGDYLYVAFSDGFAKVAVIMRKLG